MNWAESMVGVIASDFPSDGFTPIGRLEQYAELARCWLQRDKIDTPKWLLDSLDPGLKTAIFLNHFTPASWKSYLDDSND